MNDANRRSARTLLVLDDREGRALLAPEPGFVRDVVAAGTRVGPGDRLATLEVLGEKLALLVPRDVGGYVVAVTREAGAGAARRAVSYGEPVAYLARATSSASDVVDDPRTAVSSAAAGTLVVRAPSSGRFYVRPAPDKPEFVTPGASVSRGDTVGLLEVMKTFHRVAFGGDDLPERAIVRRVVPADGDDVEEGAVLVEVERAAG